MIAIVLLFFSFLLPSSLSFFFPFPFFFFFLLFIITVDQREKHAQRREHNGTNVGFYQRSSELLKAASELRARKSAFISPSNVPSFNSSVRDRGRLFFKNQFHQRVADLPRPPVPRTRDRKRGTERWIFFPLLRQATRLAALFKKDYQHAHACRPLAVLIGD